MEIDHKLIYNMTSEEVYKFINTLPDNILDFYSVIGTRIGKRFKVEFPQYFINCQTRDHEVYKTSLTAPYKYYISILNGIYNTKYSNAGYFITNTDNYGNYNKNEWIRFMQDLETCPDIRIWCLETIHVN